MKNYEQFQNAISSEKVTLAILNGASQLVAWALHDTNIYKKTIDIAVIESVKVSGVEYTPVQSVEDLVENTYFNDRNAETFYIYNANPNSRDLIIVLTQKYFFSNKAISLPHDLNTGFDVYFEPMINRTTEFGNELDIADQGLSAIEGSGTLTLFNDYDFWQQKFDKISFDNELCSIYSYNSELKANQAKLLYTGYIESKTYDSQSISFKLKDLLYNLRNAIDLKAVSLLGYRNKVAFNDAKQRLVYGQVKGFRPTNLDAIINNSYPIQGTISVFFDSNIVIGTDTIFKNQLIPGDKLVIKDVQYTVAEITSDSTLSLTSNFADVSTGALKTEVVPVSSKSYINRDWLLSGHALSQPEVTIQAGSTTSRLVLDSTRDLFDGNEIWIGTKEDGELVRIDKVINDSVVTLSQSTEFIYPIGTSVHRPCIQNLKMNDLKLIYLKDYDVDPNAGLLNIYETAEENRSAIVEANEFITCTNGSNVFQGVETSFPSYLKPGDKVRPKDTDDWYTIKELSDTEITLTENYTGVTYSTPEPIPEITAVSGLSILKEKYHFKANGTNNLDGKYFTIFTDDGTLAIWFDIDNNGTEEPVHNCDDAIEITSINTGDNNNTILNKIKQRINRTDYMVAEVVNDTLVITQVETGVRPAAKKPTADDFTALSITKSIQKIKCVGDVGDSLDYKGFYLYDGTSLVYFWYGIDGNSNMNPIPTGNFRDVMIGTVNTDDNATTVRNKTKAAVIADGYFTVTDIGADSFLASGYMQDVSLSTMPVGYSLSTNQFGASAYDLNNKYFVIPYFDSVSVTSKTIGFWFNVDGAGSVPTITATSIVEIELDSDFTEEDVISAIAESADALDVWADVSSTEDSVKFQDKNNKTLATVLNVGTSGFIIVQAQAGITTNPFAGKLLQYKNFIFDDSKDVLSCDIYGKTDEDGAMLRTAPVIVRDLIIQSGLQSFIDETNFEKANSYFNEEISAVFPQVYSDKSVGSNYREVINLINGSVFGILIQSNDFKLQYESIRPQATASMLYLNETDVLNLEIEVSSDKIILDTSVQYATTEYDPDTKSENTATTVTKISPTVQYLSKKKTSRLFKSALVNESDAIRLAGRWSFLLENSSNIINIQTKLQAIQVQIGDVFQLSHSKLPKRFGSQGNVRLLMIQTISKSASGVTIEAIDLSNAINRVAKITEATTTWSESNNETKLISGYYTDENGLIDNDENSYFTNKYW